MFTSISESRARFAAEALLTFASQVRRYCQSYPARVAGLNEPERKQAMRKFTEHATTLTTMLRRLEGMARQLDAMQVLNFEQLEAQSESTFCALRRFREEEALRN